MTQHETTQNETHRIETTHEASHQATVRMVKGMRSIERVLAAADREGARVIAVTGAGGGTGVSKTALMIADGASRAKREVLLLDLSRPIIAPGSGAQPHGSLEEGLATVERLAPGLSRATPRMTLEMADEMRDIATIERQFARLQGVYSLIVIDLPDLAGEGGARISPLTPARAADLVFIMAASGETTAAEAADAAAQLREVQAKIGGWIFNEHEIVSPGEGLSRFVKGLRWLAPKRIDRWAQALRRSPLLN